MRKLPRRAVWFLLKGLTFPMDLLKSATRARTAQRLVPIVTAETARGGIRFHVPSKMALYWPKRAFLDEPGTVGWIDRIEAGGVLWDVGANVGSFAMYAALGRGVRVHAFEPNPFTFATLVRNLALNRLSEGVSPYCLALSDRTCVDRLHLSSDEEGSVLNVFGAGESDRGYDLKREFSVSVPGFSIDDAVTTLGIPHPSHLKIDVDNIEDRIVAGAARTLADPRLRSVLIEMDTHDAAQVARIEAAFTAAGLAAASRQSLEDTRFYNQIYERA